MKLFGDIPSWPVLVTGGLISFIWASLCLYGAGTLKKYKGLRTGYTRKIFHFAIFFTVALVHWQWGFVMVCLFGTMTTAVIFYAIFKGTGNIFYEAMAREKDEPHRTHYIIVPYFATLIGGLASNILFGPLAVVGYLVTGLGDAVGEPVGVRFGKHQYRVPSLTSVKAIRSWEGSAAVFVMSAVAITGAILLTPELSLTGSSVWTIPLVALLSSIVEAVSPHGWDNATMQIIPTFLAKLIL